MIADLRDPTREQHERYQQENNMSVMSKRNRDSAKKEQIVP